MKTPFLAACLLLSLLAGCGGGGTAGSPADVVAVTVDKQQVVGYWSPSNPVNESYEFFSSATESPYAVGARTGRILQNGIVSSLFTWDMQTDGTISLNAVSPTCVARPLGACAATHGIRITASGSSIHDATWTIAVDTDRDGVAEKKTSDTYRRTEIDLSGLAAGDVFFTSHANRLFDSPLYASAGAAGLSLRLEDFDRPVTVSSPGYRTRAGAVVFAADDSMAVVSERGFNVSGAGYRPFPVKQWYEQVRLVNSADGKYSLSYERHRKVLLPPAVDPNLVTVEVGSVRLSLADYEAVEPVTHLVGMLNTFIAAPPIQALERWFMSLDLNFTTANTGNDILFTSALEGEVGNTLAHRPAAPAEVKKFRWSRRADGGIVLAVAGYGDVTLRFVKAINGGYQVLYDRPDRGAGVSYRLRDFIRDAAPVLDETSLAGRYVFTSSAALTNGTHEYSVTFHKNHTVSGAAGGFWFQDANGDLVGFECATLAGQEIADYATCAAALDNTANIGFAHVRRLRFVSRDGQQFQAKYNASVYGTRSFLIYPQTGDPIRTTKYFTAVGAPFDSQALTYRFVRLGDE